MFFMVNLQAKTRLKQAQTKLEDRLYGVDKGVSSKLLEQYANPVLRKLK